MSASRRLTLLATLGLIAMTAVWGSTFVLIKNVLARMPVAEGSPSTPYMRVYQESALRAIIACQPYNLPVGWFDEWKAFAPVFKENNT